MYCISRLRFSDIGGMAEVDEQRVCIKFCVRLGKTGSETFEMLKQAFGDLTSKVSKLLFTGTVLELLDAPLYLWHIHSFMSIFHEM